VLELVEYSGGANQEDDSADDGGKPPGMGGARVDEDALDDARRVPAYQLLHARDDLALRGRVTEYGPRYRDGDNHQGGERKYSVKGDRRGKPRRFVRPPAGKGVFHGPEKHSENEKKLAHKSATNDK
jgi:hypothetical protein